MQSKVQAILFKHMKGDMVNLCLEPAGTIEKGRCRSESSKDDEEQETKGYAKLQRWYGRWL